MKYIDADKLKAEIERRMTENYELAEKADEAFGQRAVEDNDILALIASLRQEQPEVDLEKETEESEKPINPDDAMEELNEKIALVKQKGTWDGVDVDKYMDEVRGREPEKPMEGLDEEIDRLWESFADEMEGPHNLFDIYARLARHFAQWQKEQMMKEAVEGYVNYYEDSGGILILMAEAQVGCPYHNGDKVRIVIVKE